MNKLVSYLFDFKKQSREVKWFKNALSLYLLYKVFIYIFLFSELFSNNRLIYHFIKQTNSLIDIAFFLNIHYSQSFALILIFLIAIFSFLELLNVSNYFIRFMLWIIMNNMSNFLNATLTAGDYLLNLFLFFNIFLSHKTYRHLVLNELTTAFHNISLIALKIQICLVYFLSACYKLSDVNWLNGSSVYKIFQIPEYSNSLFEALPYWICVIGTYLVLFYQLSFIVTVWIKPIKKYVLIFGIFLHLIIAFGLGLFNFGVIMILAYIPFLNYDYSISTKID
ncbi:MAG: hypothetical protein ACK504_02555 [Bacteroidota bacterium]